MRAIPKAVRALANEPSTERALANAERQRAFKQRRAERFIKMETALNLIIAKLEGRNKALSNEIRAIAQEALK